MRKMLVAAIVAAFLTMPAMAQFQFPGLGGRGGQQDLLTNKSVQEELKLSDKQKEEVGEVSKKSREGMGAIFEAFKDGDTEKAKELGEKLAADRTKAMKKIREGLTSVQSKRLREIEVQQASKNSTLDIFKNEDVQKDLKLTAKQKTKLAEINEELAKDTKEVMDDAKGDRTRLRESMTKLASLRKDAFTSFTKTLDADQKAAWKDMAGKEFELKAENPFGKGGDFFKKKKKDE